MYGEFTRVRHLQYKSRTTVRRKAESSAQAAGGGVAKRQGWRECYSLGADDSTSEGEAEVEDDVEDEEQVEESDGPMSAV